MITKDSRLNYLGLRPYGDLNGLTCYTTKKGKTVWFDKSPPTKPPTHAQRMQRIRFELAAQAWAGLTPEMRNDWHTACRLAHLYVHGYNLWIYWQLKRDRPSMRTIERLSGISLVPE